MSHIQRFASEVHGQIRCSPQGFGGGTSSAKSGAGVGVGPWGSFPMARPGHKEPMNESIKAIMVSLLHKPQNELEIPQGHEVSLAIMNDH